MPMINMLSWRLHRWSGIGIVLFVGLHMLASLSTQVFGSTLLADTINSIYMSVYFQIVVVFIVYFHALHGLRVILLDFWPKFLEYQKEITIDDVTAEMAKTYNVLPSKDKKAQSWKGSVFTKSEWVYVGDQPSRQKSAHARPVGLWALKERGYCPSPFQKRASVRARPRKRQRRSGRPPLPQYRRAGSSTDLTRTRGSNGCSGSGISREGDEGMDPYLAFPDHPADEVEGGLLVITGLKGESHDEVNDGCKAVIPAMGTAAASSNDRLDGFIANAFSGAHAYSAKAPVPPPLCSPEFFKFKQ
jgi:succinate dehydrogenase / fumarate reductase cytochrome b subunit